MLSIPEKGFLLLFLSVFIFYFLGLTKIGVVTDLVGVLLLGAVKDLV